ncbi:MAG: Regulatory protein, LuxR:Response regulator receiver [Nitrospira sp.]|jgi:DNA-binding NarL/FixJ family response regulator|nr:MAG: Regulatory protein, LuxR:Response regulator receiver [Nitrospira sp.]
MRNKKNLTTRIEWRCAQAGRLVDGRSAAGDPQEPPAAGGPASLVVSPHSSSETSTVSGANVTKVPDSVDADRQTGNNRHPSTFIWKPIMTMPQSKTPHVFIVNPQELVRVGIRTLLESVADFTVVGEATSRMEALPLILQLRPDIVILDLRVQDGKGIETAKDILANLPATRLLFLADNLNDTILLSAVATGAHGYVLQEAGADTLLHALRTITKGQSYLDPSVTRHTFAYLRKLADREPERGLHLLSPQEQRLLPLIAQGKTNKEIAAELGLSDKTIKNYLANVYTKLHLTRRSQAAAFYLKHVS